MFTLRFSTISDAFYQLPGERAEAARVLRNIAVQVEAGRDKGNVFDHRGNTIGEFELDPAYAEGEASSCRRRWWVTS